MGRWRWVASGTAAAAVACLLVLGGFPGRAEAWADRHVVACGSSTVPATPTGHPRNPSEYRMRTLHAAGCHAWRRLHRHARG